MEGWGCVQGSAIGSKTRDRAVCGLECFSLLVCSYSWEEAGLVVWVGGGLAGWVGGSGWVGAWLFGWVGDWLWMGWLWLGRWVGVWLWLYAVSCFFVCFFPSLNKSVNGISDE